MSEFNLSEINHVLESIKSIVKSGATDDYSAYLFIFRDRAVTYNGTCMMTYKYDFSSLNDEFAINFDKMERFCKNGRKDILRIDTDNNTVKAKIGTSKITLAKNIGIFDNFRNFDTRFNPDGFVPLPNDFVEGLAIARNYIGTNTKRPATNYIKVEDDIIEATNAIILCKYSMEDNMSKMFIKYDIASKLVSFAPTEYKIEKNTIFFKKDDVYFVFANSDIEYFDFSKVFGRFKESIRLNFAEDVFNCIDTANIANDKNKDSYLEVLIDEGRATLFSDSETLTSQAEVDCDSVVQKYCFKVNAKYFKTLLECNREIHVLPNGTNGMASNDRYTVALSFVI